MKGEKSSLPLSKSSPGPEYEETWKSIAPCWLREREGAGKRLRYQEGEMDCVCTF
jgi:hypothetical protein